MRLDTKVYFLSQACVPVSEAWMPAHSFGALVYVYIYEAEKVLTEHVLYVSFSTRNDQVSASMRHGRTREHAHTYAEHAQTHTQRIHAYIMTTHV